MIFKKETKETMNPKTEKKLLRVKQAAEHMWEKRAYLGGNQAREFDNIITRVDRLLNPEPPAEIIEEATRLVLAMEQYPWAQAAVELVK